MQNAARLSESPVLERDEQLLVHAYVYDDLGYREILLDMEGDAMAGTQSEIRFLYGRPRALSLGFELLPSVVYGELFVEGANLSRLEREATILLERAREFAADARVSEATVRHHAENILRATQAAIRLGGGVVIW